MSQETDGSPTAPCQFSAEFAVSHPLDVRSHHAQSTVSTSTVQPPCGPGFDADPANFTRILHFLRDGKRWQPPETQEERQSLRAEAEYFGCMALVDRLDVENAKEQSDA